MNEIKIDKTIFVDHCKNIHKKLNKPLLVILGKGNDVEEFNYNSALFYYVLGYEFPETVMIIKDKPIIITSQKKANYLQNLEGVKIIIKNKDNSNLPSIIDTLDEEYLITDFCNIKGEFSSSILQKIKVKEVPTKTFDELFLIKDEIQLQNIRKSGNMCNHILKRGIDMIRDQEYTQDGIEAHLNDKITGINPNLVELSFDPEYDDNHFRLGIRYNGMCTEVGRPFLVDLTQEYNIQDELVRLAKRGASTLAILKPLQARNPHVRIYTLGLMKEELDFKSDFVLENNTVFCLNIGNKFCNTFAMINDELVYLTKKDSKEDYLKGLKFRSKNYDVFTRLKEHQRELLDELLEEQIKFYETNSAERVEKTEAREISKYKDSTVPRTESLSLDTTNLYVIVPILSYSVPFHISLIKNCSLISNSKIRINFKEKSSGFDTKLKFILLQTNEPERFISEINEMKKDFNKVHVPVADHQVLKEKFKRHALELYMRTDVKSQNKKTLNTLELHENGFKYGDIVILFSNIKNIYFQEGDFENRAVLHMNLKEAIMLTKPTFNIQFFRKFSTLMDLAKHEDYDEEEIARINFDFANFINLIPLRIQTPEKAFLGVHSKEAVHFYTTNSTIVSLNDIPFFILNLEEVEVVNLERVTFVTKTFDCVFIFRNKAKHPVVINSIETTKLAFIKEFLDSHNIVFMQTKININWNALMESILENPLGFYQNGGWSELLKDEVSVDENESETISSDLSSSEESEDDSESYEEEEKDDSQYTCETEDDSSLAEESSDITESSESNKKKRRR